MDEQQEYFARIRNRETDQAAARARAAIDARRELRQSFDPAAAQMEGYRRMARTVGNVAAGIAGGPVDAVDMAARKVGEVANAGLRKLTGPRQGFAPSVPWTEPPKAPGFAGLDGGRVLPEVPMPDEGSIPGGLARGISTFVSLYGPLASMMGGAGATPLWGSMTAGAFADMLAFENRQGTLSDVLRMVGLDNAFTQALSGELAEDEWEASLKAALEGAGLGLLGPAYTALRRGLTRWPQMAPVFLERLAAPPKVGPGAQRGSIGVQPKRPYQAVPDSLMGFPKEGMGKRFGEEKWKHAQFVRVKWGDGAELVDAVRGANEAHALERARRNWPDAAEIQPLSRDEVSAADPDFYADVARDMGWTTEGAK